MLLVSGERFEKDFLVLNFENANIMIRIKYSYYVIYYLKLHSCLIAF